MTILGLSSRTKNLMKEAFKDKYCCLCGQQAERFIMRYRGSKHHAVEEAFYCHECYAGEPPLTVVLKEKKVNLGDTNKRGRIKKISDV